MTIPGFGLLYLSYSNGAFDVALKQIVIFIIGAFISTIIVTSFFYGIWITLTKPED